MAKRPLESNGCPKRSKREGSRHHCVIRWQEDEKYRNSQEARGWTEENCRYLDYLTTIDISYTAPWHQRHRYESTITLVCNDDESPSWTNESRKRSQTYYENSRRSSTRTRTTEFLYSEEPREYGEDDSMKHYEQTWNGSVKIGKPSGRNLLLHHLHKMVATRTSRLSMARSPMARSPIGEITSGGKR